MPRAAFTIALAVAGCIAALLIPPGKAQQVNVSLDPSQFASASAMAALSAKVPAPASSIAGTMYASICSVTVNSSTPTSTFCPVGTDATSTGKRTYPAGSLVVGKSFRLEGGGIYTVPTGNLLSADIKILVGASAVMNLTTPAAPVGSNQGVLFVALCTVRTSTTINCQGRFSFVVAGTGLSADAPFNQTSTFDPAPANLIDVTGDWNGTTTSHSTTVTQAVLMALN